MYNFVLLQVYNLSILEPAIAMSRDLLQPPNPRLQQLDDQERNKPILQISESSLIQNLNVILKFWSAFSCKLFSRELVLNKWSCVQMWFQKWQNKYLSEVYLNIFIISFMVASAAYS